MTSTRGRERPDHVFVAPSPARKVVALLTVVAAGAAAYAAWWGHDNDRELGFVAMGAAAAVLVVGWVTLAVSRPQRVTITGSIVVVRRGGTTTRYDLEDPGTDLLVRDGSVAFGHYRDDWTVVMARDVDWPVFIDVVMRYQQQADHNAEERDRRFNR